MMSGKSKRFQTKKSEILNNFLVGRWGGGGGGGCGKKGGGLLSLNVSGEGKV